MHQVKMEYVRMILFIIDTKTLTFFGTFIDFPAAILQGQFFSAERKSFDDLTQHKL